MRKKECIRFRSCRPVGRMLAEQLMGTYAAEARSMGIEMTVWLDEDLAGDLCVHLKYEGTRETSGRSRSIGLSIEQLLSKHGLVTRRLRVMASER